MIHRRLTDEEARDLVATILEAVEAAEEGRPVERASWPTEAMDWCLLLIDRLNDQEE